MLEKSSVFMMLLIVTASLVGISTMYQPTSVTTQPQQRIRGYTFRDTAGNCIAIYENLRPEVMRQFNGRMDKE